MYRWLQADGAPAGPLHRSPETAARWLARAAARPRSRPAPVSLVREDRAGRRRPLRAVERDAVVAELEQLAPRSRSARRWVSRARRMVATRSRRRRSLPRLTAHLMRRDDP
jgi:hypothetical protein